MSVKEELFRNKLIISSPTSISIGSATWFGLDTKLVGRIKRQQEQLEEKSKILDDLTQWLEKEVESISLKWGNKLTDTGYMDIAMTYVCYRNILDKIIQLEEGDK